MKDGKADDLSLGQDSLALQAIASAPNLRPSNNNNNSNNRRTSPSPPPPQPSTPRNERRRPTLEDRRQPSIRLRRLGSASTLGSTNAPVATDFAQKPSADTTNRRRSSSEPQRPAWAAALNNTNTNNNSLSVPRGLARPASTHLPRLDEETGRPSTTIRPDVDVEQLAFPNADAARPGLWKRASVAAFAPFRGKQQHHRDDYYDADANATPRRRPRRDTSANEYDSGLVDILDVVGSFASTPSTAPVMTLSNLQTPRSQPSQLSQTSRTRYSSLTWARF